MLRLLFTLVFLSACIEAPPTTFVGNADMAQDGAEPDATGDTGGSNNECVSESSAEFCARIGKNCGNVSNFDNCGKLRGTNCGSCPEGEACGGGEFTNVCAPGVCQPEIDEDFCRASGRSCGTLTGVDQCGEARTANCGDCSVHESCKEGVCECDPQSNEDFCAQRGKDCGEVTGQDSCAQMRTANCGNCTDGKVCGAGEPGTPNVCGLPNTCVPESKEVFCFNNGKNCGSVQGTDNCNQLRNENCGTCTLPESCGADGNPNVCGCIPTTCPTGACGSFPNGCGGTITCGCNGGLCNNGTCCQPMSVCLPDQCGAVTNGCGGTINCQCLNGGSCYQGQCCTPRTCGFAECGTFDNCGTPTDCGTCTFGECVGGSCQCNSETDAAFCTRNMANCGLVTATNNCGVLRTIDCGACTTKCTNNVCEENGGN